MAADFSSPQSECSCCPVREVPEPTITRLTCGVALSKTNFHTSVRSSIPDDAEDMYWLRLIRFANRGGTSSAQTDCSPGTWVTKDERTETGAYLRDVYDPDDDCSMVQEAGGTATQTAQTRADPCGTPPDNTLTYDLSRSLTMRTDDDVWDYTGTENGSAISGSLSASTSWLYSGAYGYPSPTYSLAIGTSPISVIQTATQSGTGTTSGTDWAIDLSVDFGYDTPDDFRLEFAFTPAADDKFFQLRSILYFTPSGGPETEVGPVEVDWKTGDAPVVLQWAYTEIGSFRLGTVRVRHGKSGPFTEFHITP